MKNETIQAIVKYLELNDKWKNSYFWSNFGNAGNREWQEKNNCLQYSGDGIELDFHVDLSRKNAYVTRKIMIDGVKRTAAALKKYIK